MASVIEAIFYRYTMADAKISALTALSAVPAAGDLIPLVDVSDTSMAASGTTKHALFDYLIRLRLSSESITTGNATVTVNTHHLLDVSGMTANRNFTLPSGTAGDLIRVTLGVGDATYALILIGDTGVAINGGSTATEWSRIFITGESVTFLCTAANAWWVITDGRIPQIVTGFSTTATSASSATWTLVNLDASAENDNASLYDGTNDLFKWRRTGKLLASYGGGFSAVNDQKAVVFAMYLNGAPGGGGTEIRRAAAAQSRSSSGEFFVGGASVISLTAGDNVYLYGYQSDSTSLNMATTDNRPRMAFSELLTR